MWDDYLEQMDFSADTTDDTNMERSGYIHPNGRVTATYLFLMVAALLVTIGTTATTAAVVAVFCLCFGAETAALTAVGAYTGRAIRGHLGGRLIALVPFLAVAVGIDHWHAIKSLIESSSLMGGS